MGRSGRRMRCPKTGKTQFRAYGKAAKVGARLAVPPRVYRCPECGFWHLTQYDQASYDRHQAELRSRGEDSGG